ncbi:hypothetical protein BDF21DRAFT_381961 [Thamnidium elegans]|nr:hypothetical protein BDF21DRAFT_381961 [Thamnidium elegans]
MESEFTLTTEEFWKNTIRTVESAYCWLLTYENKDYELVENSIISLKKLIRHGKSYEAMKTYLELEPSGQIATCISVTNASQLDQVIEDVYDSKRIAVDCEFLGLRKSLPELKLLQIGVSKYKGYAIQVDIIGVQVVTDKLKRILEDESLDIIGWAFRSDALAIESYIHGIELSPVLDLQAKLKPIAVEQMNLGNALNKFASEWIGNHEFQKAKLTGSQFLFTGDDCIWLMCPLPPKALVYAVFDVLSVLALHEYTQHYPSLEEYYWPYTVTSQSSQKAVDRWHVQRAAGINSTPNTGTINIVKPKNPAKPPVIRQPSTNAVRITEDGYDDEDIRFQRDLQVALERSVKDVAVVPNAAESSGTDRVIEPTSTYKSTSLQSLEQELNSTLLDQKVLSPRFSDAPTQETNDAEIEYDTWDINTQTGQKNNENIQSSTNQWSTYTEAGGNQWKNKWDASSKGSPNQWNEPKLNPVSSPNNNNNLRLSPTHVPSNLEPKEKSPQFISCKPDKKKYTSDLKSRIQVGNQGGSFTWAPETKDQMSSKTWKTFVNSTIDDWKKGKDLTMDALMNPAISEQQEPTSSSEPVKFNTKVHDNYTRGGKIGDSETGTMNSTKNQNNWEVKEERPDVMQMPMNQIPIRTKFTGPRIENPYADYHGSDDDDGSNRDEDFPIINAKILLAKKTEEKTKSQIIESLPTFVDGTYLYSEDAEPELYMLKLTTPEELDMVYMPPEGTNFTVAIGYHFIRRTRGVVLKAIQTYLSTGESYTALVEKTFMMKPAGSLKNTKFGRLLTDPSIKRVCWSPSYIEEEMTKKLGFTIGPCVDLAFRANYGKAETFSFIQSIDLYLRDWPDRKQFMDAKHDFETLNAKKFSSTCWDREKLPESVIMYSALQGLAIYCLYQKTLKAIEEDDKSFMYGI